MFRDWFADNLGVGQARKEQVYLEICSSLSLDDASYWIQVLFAAGIATLGLVLNSPAVIIGAMLISPLMGGILANGLALAAGDVILAMRSLLNLLLSCLVAISFAVLLVTLLPFKEITSEILARTRPNILDLVIALFSGAVGSVAICKEPRGVATSIPGVAIAVALMPPLCVVGYGIGVAISVNSTQGLQVASGGGLLFFTNLVAITFTAMLVFLGLHIDNDLVREKVREWRHTHPESVWVQSLLEKLPAYGKFRKIGSLPGRLLLIFITIGAIIFPLNRSLSQLGREIAQQQQDNRNRSSATDVWQKNFATFPNGEPRSFISNISTSEQNQKLTIQLQVFSSQQYSSEEQDSYIQQLAPRLGRPPELLALKLVEIPTASNELLRPVPKEPTPEPVLSIAQLQSSFLQEVQSALRDLRLPPPAEMLNYELITSPVVPLSIRVVYLSEREIDRDAQILVADSIRNRLNYESAQVSMQRIASNLGAISFEPEKSEIRSDDIKLLDRAGRILQQQPSLNLEMIVNQEEDELAEVVPERSQAIKAYLESQWQISSDRIDWQTGTESQRSAILQLTVKLPRKPVATLPKSR
ncbi:DUF389 domain-containing protein [Nodularia spumigena CS-584]|jgi:uncharacterized hydrophobic protein (TIGR00271 family)|uniref:DUF389 domain-containing protein n=1 Tax=Nodularia spumigena UHCC 0060 TaxID=3110300 RepID=A0ABU5UN03_NODSP|nr:DUF389 domain-containing protein [Nodularia spumigena]AHJ29881.1 hypothetical protein NSP_35700 [Nodularia spumigena CCY9414]MDB9382371.1 DUF389 domain-containing protein [Nodularia spumigena CS-584]MEA5524344.1 DUF389 domain-containing protein [Nodularia spumigena UHCC 0143]MEA5556054.1 DUF389 domain-containing protein [Nodularia spumigena CH309]MEA5607308.1 DUF389 domain-containing protein [Nodularia spumigena UHCC 0060]